MLAPRYSRRHHHRRAQPYPAGTAYRSQAYLQSGLGRHPARWRSPRELHAAGRRPPGLDPVRSSPRFDLTTSRSSTPLKNSASLSAAASPPGCSYKSLNPPACASGPSSNGSLPTIPISRRASRSTTSFKAWKTSVPTCRPNIAISRRGSTATESRSPATIQASQIELRGPSHVPQYTRALQLRSAQHAR